jgi:metallo-beta-lactamase class B
MRSLVASAFAIAATLVVAGCAQAPPTPSPETVAAQIRAVADDIDWKPLLTLCNAAPAIRPDQASIDKLLAAVIGRPAPDPGRVFENLYFVGSSWVSAWAIRTSQGVILIDALNNADEARQLIPKELRGRETIYPVESFTFEQMLKAHT